MSKKWKWLILSFFLLTLLTRKKICEHFGIQLVPGYSAPAAELASTVHLDEEVIPPINDTIYVWDDIQLDWIPVNQPLAVLSFATQDDLLSLQTDGPIEVEWPTLIDINYQLKYYEQLETEMYAPVFPKAVKKLDGKEIIIEGFVIPFDETGEYLALSANPFAACFFCGKASPASVMSLYLRNTKKRYKMDDFIKFKGKLELNDNDPEEYYYILTDATPQ